MSIQGLVLVPLPYFNEAGYEKQVLAVHMHPSRFLASSSHVAHHAVSLPQAVHGWQQGACATRPAVLVAG